MKKQTGHQAEDIAAVYLAKQGIKIINRNIYCRFGEIDIIGLDRQYLIFAEVRYRKNEYYMSIFETISKHKQNRLIKSSKYYLNTHRQYQQHSCRYDVIGITGELEKPTIEWIKNAFQA